MENRAKLRFPRSLLSSLISCSTQNLLSDVTHQCHQQNHHQSPIFSDSDHQIPYSSASIEPLLPPPISPVSRAPISYPSMCRPRCPETFDEMVRESCTLSTERRKFSEQTSSFFCNDVVGPADRRCPAASLASLLTHYSKLEKKETLKNNPTKKKNKQRKKKQWRRTKRTLFGKDKTEPFSSKCSSSWEDWFSSDDEREDDDETENEAETLFSPSRSFLSLSSDPESTGSTRMPNRRKPPSFRRREAWKKRNCELGLISLEEKVKGSFAVVKSSSDPYNDFRASMVEMIMEKQIFGAMELEQLLQCFLYLNTARHHRIISEVFAEIWEALFSDLC